MSDSILNKFLDYMCKSKHLKLTCMACVFVFLNVIPDSFVFKYLENLTVHNHCSLNYSPLKSTIGGDQTRFLEKSAIILYGSYFLSSSVGNIGECEFVTNFRVKETAEI